MKKKVIKFLILGILVGLLLVGLWFVQRGGMLWGGKEDEIVEEERPAYDLYGIDTLEYKVHTVTVPRGVLLGEFLQEQGVPASRVFHTVNCFDSVFPVRKLRAGNNFSFYQRKGDSVVSYGVYRHSPRDYVFLDFRNTLSVVRAGVLPIRNELTAAHITINSSLWTATQAAGCPPELSLPLSEIFAWTVDFFGLNPGDEFQVLYNRQFIQDEEIGFGRIHAVRYIATNGDTLTAYGFDHEEGYNYWDKEGASLRGTFLKAPLKYARISSGFTYARRHPILKIVRPHTGVDYAAPHGTPVVALGDGTVTAKGYQSQGGNFLKIKHNSTYTTGYLHLSRFAKGIRAGVRVKQGQVIGYVGSTGLATGPHLDFRVWSHGKPVNPLSLSSEPVPPLDSSNLPAFAHVVREQDSLFNMLLLHAPHEGIASLDSVHGGKGLGDTLAVRAR